jgi:hypothetical protein
MWQMYPGLERSSDKENVGIWYDTPPIILHSRDTREQRRRLGSAWATNRATGPLRFRSNNNRYKECTYSNCHYLVFGLRFGHYAGNFAILHGMWLLL